MLLLSPFPLPAGRLQYGDCADIINIKRNSDQGSPDNGKDVIVAEETLYYSIWKIKGNKRFQEEGQS